MDAALRDGPRCVEAGISLRPDTKEYGDGMSRAARRRARLRRTAALKSHEATAGLLSTLADFWTAPVPSTGRDAASASVLSYYRCGQSKALGERQ